MGKKTIAWNGIKLLKPENYFKKKWGILKISMVKVMLKKAIKVKK